MALHATILLIAIIGLPDREMPAAADEKPVEIVFEQATAPRAPESAEPPAPAEPAPTPTSQPEPNARPTPPAPEPTPPPPQPVPNPEPPAPAPPRVSLDIQPPREEIPDLEAPPPLPPLPRRPRPAPVARAPRNEFTPFMRDYSFGTPSSPSPPPPGRAGRGVDLSLGQPGKTPSGRRDAPSGDLQMVSGRATRDWGRELVAWVRQRAYYPSQAAQNGEDGDVDVRVTADSTGRVQSVELVGRSGSMWLDLALQAIFRRATIPPFPPEMTDPQVTFDFTMHYILIR